EGSYHVNLWTSPLELSRGCRVPSQRRSSQHERQPRQSHRDKATSRWDRTETDPPGHERVPAAERQPNLPARVEKVIRPSRRRTAHLIFRFPRGRTSRLTH